jgi:DTW domain-containing protein YfiP
VLLDATWSEARKMFRKSPYLDHLPVLSLGSPPGRPKANCTPSGGSVVREASSAGAGVLLEHISRYQLRRSRRDDHFCTSEVAALCLDLAGEALAAQTLEAYLDVFTHHYLRAKNQLPLDLESAGHMLLRSLASQR